MTATTKSVDPQPDKEARHTKNGNSRVVALAVYAILATVVAVAAIWCLSSYEQPTPLVTDPHAAQIEELEKRGFSDIYHEVHLAETGTDRFYGRYGDCQVRLQQDRERLYAVMIDEYRIIDPTDPLLQDDPVFGKCFDYPSVPPVEDTTGG